MLGMVSLLFFLFAAVAGLECPCDSSLETTIGDSLIAESHESLSHPLCVNSTCTLAAFPMQQMVTCASFTGVGSFCLIQLEEAKVIC